MGNHCAFSPQACSRRFTNKKSICTYSARWNLRTGIFPKRRMLSAYANFNRQTDPDGSAKAGNIRSSGCHSFRSEGPAPGKDSRPSVSRGNVPALKPLDRLTQKARKRKHSLCLFLRSESHGLVTSSAAVSGGRHPLPVPASAKLWRARGSPTHICGSGTDLPPFTPEESQGMPWSLSFHR